ncbi:hypothetical protein LEP1GSC125_3063 [Leptospira mayottensis 200901122]|uniref:Uncharacterized protein n=1 Tax=Leptospira mayottensis 200901122 TaxID=1193010 RepID=A0AA87SWF4_9LEPT|nr:hypothetical protein LEP1GSC125_3063 [Leptospira mayottensis 200901122]
MMPFHASSASSKFYGNLFEKLNLILLVNINGISKILN